MTTTLITAATLLVLGSFGILLSLYLHARYRAETAESTVERLAKQIGVQSSVIRMRDRQLETAQRTIIHICGISVEEDEVWIEACRQVRIELNRDWEGHP